MGQQFMETGKSRPLWKAFESLRQLRPHGKMIRAYASSQSSFVEVGCSTRSAG